MKLLHVQESPKMWIKNQRILLEEGWPDWRPLFFWCVMDKCPGKKFIYIYEELPTPGGSLDGEKRANIGFVTRGGREMENHFETMWDMYRSIPSLEIEDASYLDEFY